MLYLKAERGGGEIPSITLNFRHLAIMDGDVQVGYANLEREHSKAIDRAYGRPVVYNLEIEIFGKGYRYWNNIEPRLAVRFTLLALTVGALNRYAKLEV